MPSQPPFVLPPDPWRARLAGLLAGVGRQSAAVALVVLVALAGAGALWVRGAARPAGPPAAPAGPDGRAGAAGSGPGSPSGGPPGGGSLPSVAPGGAGGQAPVAGQGAGGTVAVDVVGRVWHAGVVRLPAGSRVLDAVQAAGGALPGADLDAINLARKVADGEQIRVPARGEHPQPATDPGSGGGAGADAGAAAGPVDLNTATVEQLDALPGVGEVTVNRIVAYRTAHPFRSIEELRQVDGIGDRRFAVLKDLVTVG